MPKAMKHLAPPPTALGAPPLSPAECRAIADLIDQHVSIGWPGDTTARLAFTAGAVAGYVMGKDKGR